MKNQRRLVRAVEICLLRSGNATGVSSAARRNGNAMRFAAVDKAFSFFATATSFTQRINRRVETMFESGVIEEVRAIGAIERDCVAR